MPDTPPTEPADSDKALERAVGQELVAARHRAGMTQAQIAEALGTYQGNIARLEAGRVSSTLETLQRFAAATGSRVRISIEPAE